MTFQQSLAVTLGAELGSTFLGQLVAFPSITKLSTIIIAAGFFSSLLTRTRKQRSVALNREAKRTAYIHIILETISVAGHLLIFLLLSLIVRLYNRIYPPKEIEAPFGEHSQSPRW
jgi:Na+/phosphate symporter